MAARATFEVGFSANTTLTLTYSLQAQTLDHIELIVEQQNEEGEFEQENQALLDKKEISNLIDFLSAFLKVAD